MPLFWRLLGVNLIVVLGGALVGTWLTQRLVLNGSFTPLTHAVLVLAALCLSAGLTMLLLRETFRPIHSLREATRRFNAGEHSARASLAPLTDPDVAALVLDVNALWDRLEADAATIREKTEQAERLAAQVIMAQEEERRRVARELHDEAGQALTAVIIGLERGLASMPEAYAADLPVQPRQLISNLRDLAAQTLDEVRKLALELRPSVLDDLGLVAALRQYVRATEERSGLAAQLTVVGLGRERGRAAAGRSRDGAVPHRAGSADQRDSARARASRSRCACGGRRDGVTLEVRDDGIGLGAASAVRAASTWACSACASARGCWAASSSPTPVSPRGTLVQVMIVPL